MLVVEVEKELKLLQEEEDDAVYKASIVIK